MQCNLCGYDHLNKRTVVYAQRCYSYGNPKPYYEIVPVCKDCAERIEAGLIEQMKLVKTGQRFRWRKRRARAQFRDGCKIETKEKTHT